MKKSIFLFFAAIMCAVSVQAKKIYLFPSSDWQLNNAKMGAYTWNSSNSNDNKPQLMSQISGVTPVVYEVDIPDSHNKVIFLRMNNTATAFDWSKEWSRTEQNIPSDGKNCFFIKGWTDATKWDTYTYTVVGNKDVLGSDWDTGNSSNDMVKIDDDNWALVKRNVSLKKNTNYEYKLVMAHSWDYWSTPSTNAKLTVTADGTYDVMFTYNYKTNKLTHTAVLPQTIYCINTQEWDKVSIHNWLTDKITTTWPGDAMTKTGEKWAGYDIYKKEISGLHKYCIFNNNNNGKKTSDLTIDGTYYELGSGKWYKELPTPKICWKGDVNNWSEKNTFAVTNNDPNLFTTTVALSKGEHTFKVSICDLWLSNPGTMKRHGESVHEGGWDFKNATADECKIEADLAGDYIFTWNISEKKLTVTYPLYPDLSKQPDVIYFQPSERWPDGNARFAAYFCKGNTKDKWEDLTDTDGDGIYEVNNAKGHTTVIIVRMNPAYDENRWNTDEEDHSAKKPVWNKTGDLLIPMDGNDCFKMTPKNNNEWDNSGEWSLYVPTIQLVDGDNSETLTKYSGKKVNAQVNRTFVADGGYYTICLPFDLQASEIGIAYQVTSITEHIAEKGFNMVFSEVSELIAGQPYLILPNNLTNNLTNNPIFKNVIISYTGNGEQVHASGAGVNFNMQGIINGSGSTNGLYWVGNNGYFYNDNTSILGLRTYFSITDNAGKPLNIRARVVVSENAATGLDNITNRENTTIKVIENGQLIIIRNGEKFNAQGQKL